MSLDSIIRDAAWAHFRSPETLWYSAPETRRLLGGISPAALESIGLKKVRRERVIYYHVTEISAALHRARDAEQAEHESHLEDNRHHEAWLVSREAERLLTGGKFPHDG